MFTGIIEETGVVLRIGERTAGARITVGCRKVLEDAAEGASISVNGVCLTAVDPRPDSFSADVAPETLSRSNLGGLQPGSALNLERPLSPSGRLGGHIVQGHVDATGTVAALDLLGDNNWWLHVRFPAEIDRYLVEKGSVAIDGISLTIASVEDDVFAVTVIPHTYKSTIVKDYRPGTRVNLECDILAKYVEKMLAGRLDKRESLTAEKLRALGY